MNDTEFSEMIELLEFVTHQWNLIGKKMYLCLAELN